MTSILTYQEEFNRLQISGALMIESRGKHKGFGTFIKILKHNKIKMLDSCSSI